MAAHMNSQIDSKEFLRRVNYLRGHLEAVVRMVEEDRDCGEVLRQMRAVRRASANLEVQCLLSHLVTGDGDTPVGEVRKVIELYRLSQR